MPKYRLLHMNCRTGRRSRQLTRLEYHVWVAYMLSADDFGVCPYSARKLQADDPWLAHEATKVIARSLETLLTVDLVRSFTDGQDGYLYQPDWQTYQKIKHPSKTSLPPVPGELLEKCCAETQELFRQHHPKSGELFPQSFSKSGETFPLHAGACDALATANANALGSSLEESPRETFPAGGGKPRPIVESPARWGIAHGDHVNGFCDWRCFPNELAYQFAAQLAERDHLPTPEDAVPDVVGWARSVRASGVMPVGKMFDFWNRQWTLAHGEKQVTASRSRNVLAEIDAWGQK